MMTEILFEVILPLTMIGVTIPLCVWWICSEKRSK